MKRRKRRTYGRQRSSRAGFGGAWCVPELFASAFEGAVHGIDGRDLARLVHDDAGSAASLGWIDAGALVELERFLSGLRYRERRRRYLLDKTHHRRLAEILGSDLHARPRSMFVLALAVDEAFDEFPDDAGALPSDMLQRTTSRCRGFFADTQNKPPPIGQMTTMAVCRTWFQRFWYTGNVSSARTFGPMPRLDRVSVPERTTAALATAIDADELRLAVACWPAGPLASLNVDESVSGRFAVRSRIHQSQAAQIEALIEAVASRRSHLLILPELALTEGELEHLQKALERVDARYPALVIAGLCHRRPQGHECHVNEAVVLTSKGRELFRHEKLEPFTDSKSGRFEDIVPRRSALFHYMDTPIGRLTVNVCRDFRSDIPMILNRVLGAAGILVPAFSDRLDFATEEARVLGARQEAFTLAANPWCTDLRDAASVYFPIRGKDAGHRLEPVSDESPTSARVLFYRIGIVDPRHAVLDAGPHAIM